MKLLETVGWMGLGTMVFGTAWLIGLCFAITKSEDFGLLGYVAMTFICMILVGRYL